MEFNQFFLSFQKLANEEHLIKTSSADATKENIGRKKYRRVRMKCDASIFFRGEWENFLSERLFSRCHQAMLNFQSLSDG